MRIGLNHNQKCIAKKFNIADVDDKFDYKFLLRQLEIYHDDIDEIEVELVFDTERDRYLLLDVGWDGKHRVHHCIFHFDLKEGVVIHAYRH